ncbi:LOW QUALITY PROTEIN: protein FAM227A [Ciconia maguari]
MRITPPHPPPLSDSISSKNAVECPCCTNLPGYSGSSFWWLFFHLHQPTQEMEEQLFHRIAKNYPFLLLDCHRFHHQEALIKVLIARNPNIQSSVVLLNHQAIARKVHASVFWIGKLLITFPISCFGTDESKTQLCNAISQWTIGMLPVPRSSTNWDYSHLEPEKLKMNNLLSPKGKEFKLSLASFLLQSHPTCCGPDLTWHLSNINGHSPLICHFLQSCNAEPWSGWDILIHRREISNPIPQSFRHIHKMDTAFKEAYQRHCRMRDLDQKQQKDKQEFLKYKKIVWIHPTVF